MVKEILYTTAIDKNGNQIHVRDAKKEEIYYCPICKNEFILRKSGKTGKGSKRPHFAHHEISTNCTPEGVLHYLSKINVIKILEDYKSENKPFIINWKCIYCEKKNTGNIF